MEQDAKKIPEAVSVAEKSAQTPEAVSAPEKPAQTPEAVSVAENPEGAMSAKEFTRKFARAAGIRAARTMAQTALSLLSAKAFVCDVDWKALLSAVVMAGIISVLTSVATGLPETEGAEILNKGGVAV